MERSRRGGHDGGGDRKEAFRRPKVTKVWVPSSPSSRPNHATVTPAIDSAWSTCSGAALRSATACILEPAPTHPPLRHDGRFLLRAALRAAGSQDCPHERVAHSSARGGPLVRPQTTLSGAMQLNQSAIICCSLTLASSRAHAATPAPGAQKATHRLVTSRMIIFTFPSSPHAVGLSVLELLATLPRALRFFRVYSSLE